MSLCKLCNTAEARYKCPTCLIPYCSLACYKPHKASHAETTSSTAPAAATTSLSTDTTSSIAPDTTTSSSSLPPASRLPPSATDLPATITNTTTAIDYIPATAPAASAEDPFSTLLATPHLLTLIQRNPTLHALLYSIYLSTLEPLPPAHSATPASINPYRIAKRNKNPTRQWTPEIGLQKGLKRLSRIRNAALRNGDGGTLEEFVQLVLKAVGTKVVEKQEPPEVHGL
ncbi:hypothetical protein BDZ91DRAFT_195801 [Kalaharituber pfeilii]|nr:hypothetical protein BDZ91DRAFT_195801 [Kalaharituber pfeilii]